MNQDQETGLKAVLSFNQAFQYLTNKVTDLMAGDLSSFVNDWWSNLSKVYRELRLSLEADRRPDISLFYLQIRLLDAIWSFYVGRRDGPSPYTRMMADAMRDQINGKGDCIVAWAAILEKLQDDPSKTERILESPRGSIEYSIQITLKGGSKEVPKSETRPLHMASQAGQKGKRAHTGQTGKATKTRRRSKATPDVEHRNADVEDDSSDVAVKSEEDSAPNVIGSVHLGKVQSGSGSGQKKALAGTNKYTTPSQSATDSGSQSTATNRSWFDFMKPDSRPSGSGTSLNKTLKMGSQSTKTLKVGGQSTKIPKAGSQSTKIPKEAGPSTPMATNSGSWW